MFRVHSLHDHDIANLTSSPYMACVAFTHIFKYIPIRSVDPAVKSAAHGRPGRKKEVNTIKTIARTVTREQVREISTHIH